MLARPRRYRSVEEAVREWSRLGLEMPPSALTVEPEDNTFFVEGRSKELEPLWKEATAEGIACAVSESRHVPRLCLVAGEDDLEVLGAIMDTDLLASALATYRSNDAAPIVLPSGTLTFDRSKVMGILNTTPDSFSDGGSYVGTDEGVLRALIMVEEGADIIDIGGESTRPGAEPVPLEEELRRVVPVIRLIAEQTDVPISIDTRKPEVARAAIEAGAQMINDVSGLGDPAMAEVAADNNVPVVLMHMLGDPQTMQKKVDESTYDDIVSDIMWAWEERMCLAEDLGLGREKIILDPGLGFGKLPEHNLEILYRLREFRCSGRPIMVGASRKAFLGKITGAPADQRLGGSLAAAAISVLNGASVVRVHDVKETVALVRTIEAVRGRPI